MTEGAAPAASKASGDQGDKAGESLPAKSHAEAEGDAPMGAAPGKTEQVDDAEDDYTSESTEEVPALHGPPLSTGARMWTPSQFPQTLILCKNLNSGEFLAEEAQLTRLGYGRTRAVYTLPPRAQHTYPQDCVLKLCMVRQHSRLVHRSTPQENPVQEKLTLGFQPKPTKEGRLLPGFGSWPPKPPAPR